MSIKDQVVLITGGTGSFGRKFAEIVLRDFAPAKLIIFSRDELKQHDMHREFDDERLRFFIGDVRDVDRLRRAMQGVDVVVHAAALKQVPACEYNPMEAILTNVMGAKNVIDAAIDGRVEKTVALSTDKAVNPANLYGATKLCAEKLFVQSNSYGAARNSWFSCVRYGNVVGSRGSVIPVFQQQRQDGKITITDKRMTRFWISLDQGVRFVVRCIGEMQGGEVFIPKIPSTNIMDVKEAVAPECEVEYVGIRPGEKLHEVLISEDEARQTVECEDMYVIQPAHAWWRDEYGSSRESGCLPDGFRYVSSSDDNRLSVEALRDLLA